MSYVGLGNLLSCGNTELYFRVPKESDVKKAMQRIHNHVRKMRSKCSTTIIYACDENGEGMKIIHIILDEPIIKKSRGKQTLKDEIIKEVLNAIGEKK